MHSSSLCNLSHDLDAEELPVRLAHRVKELDELPYNLSDMPSIRKVKNWYAQSFEVGSFIPGSSIVAKFFDINIMFHHYYRS